MSTSAQKAPLVHEWSGHRKSHNVRPGAGVYVLLPYHLGGVTPRYLRARDTPLAFQVVIKEYFSRWEHRYIFFEGLTYSL